jgi:hypothetical protein
MKKILSTLLIIIGITPVAIYGQWTSYNVLNSPLQTDYIIGLTINAEQKLLVGTQGYGLFVKDSSNWSIYNQANTSVPINYPFAVRYDTDTLFIGSASGNLDLQPLGEGMSILNPGDSSWHQFNSGLSVSPIITGIQITPNYRAVCTYGGGITIFNSSGWICYQTEFRTEFTYADSQQQTFKVPAGTYIPTDYLRGMTYDSAKQTLWIATLSGGAVTYTAGQWYTYNQSNSGLPSSRVQLISINDYNGKIYFGSFGLGLAEKNGSTWTVYNTTNSPISGDFIHALGIRPDNGDLWIGTSYGISVLDTAGNWYSYTPGDSGLIWGDYYSAFAFDTSGNVWVGTYGGGIATRKIRADEPPPPPPPPPQDTLAVELDMLKFFLRSPERSDITWLNVTLAPSVQLADTDSVAISVSSQLGQIYSWNRTFEPFYHIFHWRNTDLYFALINGSTVLLKYRSDLNTVQLFLLDWTGSVNRANIAASMDIRIKYGKYLARVSTLIGPVNPTEDPDADTLAYNSNDIMLSSESIPAITGIDNPSGEIIPQMAELPVAYPNPFNPITNVSFSLTRPAAVRFAVYDILGRQVSSMTRNLEAGNQTIAWDGSSLPTGVYYYTININNERYNGKMTLLK